MNFEIVNIRSFKLGIDFYKRIYSVQKKRNGLLRLTNVFNGETLIDNLNPETVTIDSKPMQNIEQLQMVIMNQQCLCEKEDDGGGGEFKTFDKTFDRTFE